MLNLLANVVEKKDFTLSEGLLYSLVGFLLVIFVLIFLMCVIKGLSAIVAKCGNKTKKTAAVIPETPPVYAPGRSGEVKLFDVPDKDAAMVMAIIADQLQVPLNTLEFVSIKEVKEGEEQR